jgi:hypothetical protein
MAARLDGAQCTLSYMVLFMVEFLQSWYHPGGVLSGLSVR